MTADSEDLLQSTSSTTYLSVESHYHDQPAAAGSSSSTTPRVDLAHAAEHKLEISEEKSGVKQPGESSDNATAMDETLALQDSPAQTLNSEPVQEGQQAGLMDVDTIANTTKRPEPSAPDSEQTIERLPFIVNGEAVTHQEAPSDPAGISSTHELVASPSNNDDNAHQEQEQTLRSPKLAPVQTETHLLSPEDPLTNSPTASNPNTPDSQDDHMLSLPTTTERGADDAPSKAPQLPELPLHEALPNPFEFLQPISTSNPPPWTDIPRPHSASAGLHRHRDEKFHRLPSVLRPANRHHLDTEGSRRASMVPGWEFTPPTLFPSGGNQLSPRDRTVSLEAVRREAPLNPPSRPQSSASWYPRYHRINSQPVYVDNYYNTHPQHHRLNSQPVYVDNYYNAHPQHHHRLNSQPIYSSSGSSSFADLRGAGTGTPELQYTAPPSRQSSERRGVGRNSERDENEPPAEAVHAMDSVNEVEAEAGTNGNESANMVMMDGTHDDKMAKPCPDQNKQRWKFWSRNRHSQCISSDMDSSKLAVPAPADARQKVKKRLSRNLLIKKTS